MPLKLIHFITPSTGSFQVSLSSTSKKKSSMVLTSAGEDSSICTVQVEQHGVDIRGNLRITNTLTNNDGTAESEQGIEDITQKGINRSTAPESQPSPVPSLNDNERDPQALNGAVQVKIKRCETNLLDMCYDTKTLENCVSEALANT
jgi:hypothetical protein